MGSCIDLTKFQLGEGAKDIEDAFSKIVSGGRIGYKTVIVKDKPVPQCPDCKKELAGQEKFCPECGAKITLAAIAD